MIPVTLVRLSLGELLAADVDTVGPVAADNLVQLIREPFTAAETLVLADIVLADFTGSTGKIVPAGTQPVANDPATQEQVISIQPPAGGFRWETTALTNLPQTIYGYAFIDADTPQLLATAQLDTPVTLQAVGEVVDIGAVELRFLLQPIS